MASYTVPRYKKSNTRVGGSAGYLRQRGNDVVSGELLAVWESVLDNDGRRCSLDGLLV